jgi:hypothetical protein
MLPLAFVDKRRSWRQGCSSPVADSFIVLSAELAAELALDLAEGRGIMVDLG